MRSLHAELPSAISDLIEGEAEEDPEPADGHHVVGRAGRDNNGRNTLKGDVHRFNMRGFTKPFPAQEYSLLYEFFFYTCAWPLRPIQWCHGSVQYGPPVTIVPIRETIHSLVDSFRHHKNDPAGHEDRNKML